MGKHFTGGNNAYSIRGIKTLLTKRVIKEFGYHSVYRVILLDANEYLILLSRYIHLNPVRAKIVTHPLEYSWSSYPVFAGKRQRPDWGIYPWWDWLCKLG